MSTNLQVLRQSDTVRQILQDVAFFIKAVVVIFAVFGVVSAIYIRQLHRIPEFQEAAQKYEQRCGSMVQYNEHGNPIPPPVKRDGC